MFTTLLFTVPDVVTALAVTFVDPTLIPVRFPEASIVAVVGLDEFHVTEFVISPVVPSS